MGVALPGRGAGPHGPGVQHGSRRPAPALHPCWGPPRLRPTAGPAGRYLAPSLGHHDLGGTLPPGTCALLPGSRVISKDHPHPRCLDTQHSLLGTLLPPC